MARERGPEPDHPLAAALSMTIEGACVATDFNETQMRGFIRNQKLRSFKVGKRRFILVSSLRRLVEELAIEAAAKDQVARQPRRRGRHGRFVRPVANPTPGA